LVGTAAGDEKQGSESQKSETHKDKIVFFAEEASVGWQALN
jgi:hypothetical protein